MTDSLGTQVGSTVKYLPFGESRATIDIPTDKLFTGQRLDSTGLYFYNARYYDPTIGRFISADTIVPYPSDPQSFNRYSYCRNNPLKYVDPSGNLDSDYLILMQYLQTHNFRDALPDNISQTINIGTGGGFTRQEVRITSGNELIITWKDQGLTFVDHFTFSDNVNESATWERFYFNKTRYNGAWEIYDSSTEYGLSWSSILRQSLGVGLMLGGFYLTYLGCGIMIAAVFPPFTESFALGAGFAATGIWIFNMGYNLSIDPDIDIYNLPADWIP